jgi:hypothetical protein
MSMSMSMPAQWFAISAVMASCATAPEPVTGLDGLVERGPIAPVCQVSIPCDAPFAASFEVRQGTKRVATFRSDSAGHFVVHLAPGNYVIVPTASAPLMNATAQARSVDVIATGGLTRTHLTFDTGIR